MEIDYKYIIEVVYTERYKQIWKLTIKDKNKILESKVYDSLAKINKKIKSTL